MLPTELQWPKYIMLKKISNTLPDLRPVLVDIRVYKINPRNYAHDVSSFLPLDRRRRDDRHSDGVLPHVVQDPGVADGVGDH